jgi:glutamine synthetase
LKTFEDFEKTILDLYDEIQATVERLEEEKGASQAEIMCVLGNMLADAARDAGVTKETFLRTMEVTWMQDTDEPPSLH